MPYFWFRCDKHMLSPVKLRKLWSQTFPTRPFPNNNSSVLDQIGYGGTEKELLEGVIRWGSRENNYSEYECDRIRPEKKVAWVQERHQILAASALLAEAVGQEVLWRSAAYAEKHFMEQVRTISAKKKKKKNETAVTKRLV